MESAPGIHRIESTLGPRPFAQYLLSGERSLLVDSGVAATPDEVILPALRELGVDPARLNLVLVTHADVDHFGGNDALRRAAPAALFCAHADDAGWIANQERIFRERYGWYAEHGPTVDYDAETWSWLRGAVGPDVPIDIGLRGGEQIRLGPGLTVEVLHLPGHTPGHLGLWEPRSRTAIVTDAALGSGLLNMTGTVIQPPPYFDIAGYVRTIETLRALRPQTLLTAHYPVIEGKAVDAFLAESLAFVERARRVVRETLAREGELTLAAAFAGCAPELGNFSSIPNELCGPLRAHLDELATRGAAEHIPGAPPRWRWTGARS